MIDLDKLEKEFAAMHDDTSEDDPWCDYAEHAWGNLPALLAELRAARACVIALREAYQADAIREWFDDEGPAGLAALEDYDAAIGRPWAKGEP